MIGHRVGLLIIAKLGRGMDQRVSGSNVKAKSIEGRGGARERMSP